MQELESKNEIEPELGDPPKANAATTTTKAKNATRSNVNVSINLTMPQQQYQQPVVPYNQMSQPMYAPNAAHVQPIYPNLPPQSPHNPNAPFLSQHNLGNVSYQSSVDENEKKQIVDIVQQADPPQQIEENEDAMEVIASPISAQNTEDLLYDNSHRRMTNGGNKENEEGMATNENEGDMIIQSDTSLLEAKSPRGNEDEDEKQIPVAPSPPQLPYLEMNVSDNDVLNDDFVAEIDPDGAKTTKGVNLYFLEDGVQETGGQ